MWQLIKILCKEDSNSLILDTKISMQFVFKLFTSGLSFLILFCHIRLIKTPMRLHKKEAILIITNQPNLIKILSQSDFL